MPGKIKDNQCRYSLPYLAFEKNKWSKVRYVKKWTQVRYAKNLKHLTKIKALKKYEDIWEKRKHLNKM